MAFLVDDQAVAEAACQEIHDLVRYKSGAGKGIPHVLVIKENPPTDLVALGTRRRTPEGGKHHGE